MKHKQRHKHKESHIMNHKQRFFFIFPCYRNFIGINTL